MPSVSARMKRRHILFVWPGEWQHIHVVPRHATEGQLISMISGHGGPAGVDQRRH